MKLFDVEFVAILVLDEFGIAAWEQYAWSNMVSLGRRIWVFQWFDEVARVQPPVENPNVDFA